jgi:hypothetical protein
MSAEKDFMAEFRKGMRDKIHALEVQIVKLNEQERPISAKQSKLSLIKDKDDAIDFEQMILDHKKVTTKQILELEN